MTWKEVVAERGTVSGIAVVAGQVRSILCGSSLHTDAKSATTIHYDVPVRSSYRRFIMALEQNAMRDRAFAVYWKLGSNEWENLGQHRISKVVPNEQSIRFELIPARPSSRP